MTRQIILELLLQPVEMLPVITLLSSFCFYVSLKLLCCIFFFPGDDILTNEQCFNQKDSNEINVRMLF